jgi:antibiotic biosynthesis monooxygenase (ABM) superfamily enzyme
VALPEASESVRAQRLAPWSVVLMVVAAVTVALAAFLEFWPLALLAGLTGLVGVLLLAFAALNNGQQTPR